MKRHWTRASCSSVFLSILLGAHLTRAQDVGATDSSSTGSGNQGKTVVAPATTTVTDTVIPPMGLPRPGYDVNANLPSSSRPITDTSTSTDAFDLAPTPEAGVTMRGSEGGTAILGRAKGSRPTSVPAIHTVRRGDTLWGLCDDYFDDPWAWPKLWSFNPQIQNPHWIYPGDQLRLRKGGEDAVGPDRSLIKGADELIRRHESAPKGSVMLRNVAYIDDPEREKWGEVVGAREDRMLLAEDSNLYLLFRQDASVEPGQVLKIYRPLRAADGAPGARRPPGEIIKIIGRVRIEQWNPETHVARAKVLESTDVIERGAAVGPVSNELEWVDPKPSSKDIWARVIGSVYPHVYMATGQIVFLDHGIEDGLEVGNRLFVVRRGDSWRRSLTTSVSMARDRVVSESTDPVTIERTPLDGDEEDFPEEQIAELRIVRIQKFSAVAVVVQSSREVVSGDRAVSREGL